MNNYNQKDTICALATPAGLGAIGVVRLSGVEALKICNDIFPGKDLTAQKAGTLHVGRLQNGDHIVDEVVISIFRSPRSYTGQDLLEISCHGSPYIQGEILNLLVSKGARMAREGEFTFRAFMNGKLDLSQAEAVADLIASDSKASRDLAMSQLRGGYAHHLSHLREQLINFASMLELELDFSEEDVEFANRDELLHLVQDLQKELDGMISSFEFGNAIKQGVPVAIIGEPNVGKSTLLNQILKEDRAIVSEIPGTTRDVIEDVVNIEGIIFRFIDTAGLRQTTDTVEEIGILKARQKADLAKVVLYVMDASNCSVEKFEQVKGEWSDKAMAKTFFVMNKIDHMDPHVLEKLKVALASYTNVFYISARDDHGIDHLLRGLQDFIGTGKSDGEGIMVSSARHLESLNKCRESLDRTLAGIDENRSSELVAQDVRQSLHYLGEITGEVTTDDLLANIFSKFCIGK
ncbi:MAG: tRNA uridine-5-carboxymethylaminomethyl(34) synthesis GTPase MnmE [Vicingaceae bacterium]